MARVAVWVGVTGTYTPQGGQLLMTGRNGGDCLLEGLGVRQGPVNPPTTTLGWVRSQWGMAQLAPGWADDQPCWCYNDSNGDGLTMVLVEVACPGTPE